jgi:hypothetical protein
VKRTVRIAIVVAFLGLSLASLAWTLTYYPDAVAPDVTCDRSGQCNYVEQGYQLNSDLYTYKSALLRQGHARGMFWTRELLLVTAAAIAWVLASLLRTPGAIRGE